MTKKWKRFLREREEGRKKRRTGEENVMPGGNFPAGHLAPHQEAILHEGAVISGSETMPFGVKMIKDRTKSGKETLRVPRGCGNVA